MIKLTTEDGIATTNTIYLEPEVVTALLGLLEKDDTAMTPDPENASPAAPKCGYCDQPATTSNGNCREHYGRPPAGEWAEPDARKRAEAPHQKNALYGKLACSSFIVLPI